MIGWPMLAAGIGLIWWAVRSAGATEVDRPTELVAEGAYALSRNPMYLGWMRMLDAPALARGSMRALRCDLPRERHQGSNPSMATSSVPRATDAPEVRRTRQADAWTTLFLVVTAIYGIWAVVLIVLTLLTIAEPSFLYRDQKTGLKAVGATVVLLLAGYQAFTMAAVMNQVPRFGIRMKHLIRGHRYGGRTALVLAAVIAYFCMTDIGAPVSPLTSAVHGTFGGTAFAAIAVKLALLKWRPVLAYDAAPWLGRYAAVAFVVIWATSVLAYYTDIL